MSFKNEIEKQAINDILEWIRNNKKPLTIAGGGLTGLGGLFLLSDMFGADYLEESDQLKDLDKITVKIPRPDAEKSGFYNLENEIDVEKEISFMGNFFKKSEEVNYNVGEISNDSNPPSAFAGPWKTTALLGAGLPLGAYGVYKLIETYAKRQKREEISRIVNELEDPDLIEKSSSWVSRGWESAFPRDIIPRKLWRGAKKLGEGALATGETIFGGVEDAADWASDFVGKGKYKKVTAPAISTYTGLLGGAAGLGTLLGYFALKEYLGKDEEEENVDAINPQIVYEYEGKK